MGKTKAVITILGTVGGAKNRDTNKFEPLQKEKINKAKYKLDNEILEFTNTLPLLINKYQNSDYELKAIFTEDAKRVQEKILEYENLSDYSTIFDDKNCFIEPTNENQYSEILKKMDLVISNSNYKRVIIDVTHGYRHFPILMIIDLIIQNIKNINKVEKILFGKEIEFQKEYEIIDLIEYLDLANLSFIVANFKDNYTISNHINVKSEKYKPLIEAMQNFSSDIMALSLENMHSKTIEELIKAIDLIKDEIILKDDLIALSNEISKNFEFKNKEKYIKGHQKLTRYENYYNIAKLLHKNGYLIHSTSLIFEAIGFYAKNTFKTYNNKVKEYIDNFEGEIEEAIKNNESKPSWYNLSDSTKNIILFAKEPKRINKGVFSFNDKALKELEKKIKNVTINKQKELQKQIEQKKQEQEQINIIKKLIVDRLNSINYENYKDFKVYIENIRDLRNNLLHSNSSHQIKDVETQVKKVIDQFKKFCIEDDILGLKNGSK